MFGRTRRDSAISIYLNATREKSIVAKASRSRRRKARHRTETMAGQRKTIAILAFTVVEMYVYSYWSFLNIPSAWLSIMRNYKFPNGLFCRDARPKSSRVARTSRPVAVWIWTEDTDCFADSRLNGPHSRAGLLATWRGKVWSRLFEGREGQESHRTRGDGTHAEGSIKRDRPYTLYIYLCAWLCVSLATCALDRPYAHSNLWKK